jgi:HK97 family phage portal protein
LGLIESISRGAFGFRADMSGAPAAWDDFWYEGVGSASSSGMRVSADSAKRIAAVLACVNIISRNVAMMPKKVYMASKTGGSEIVPNHPIYDLLASQPNHYQTAFEFFQMLQGHIELRGNAYAEIIPGKRGAVDQLIPMHPDRVTVQQLSSGRIRYQYNDPVLNQTRYLMQDEVLHPRNFSDDGITGQSTVKMAADVFGSALAAQDYSARFFQNDAKPGVALQMDAPFKDKQQEDVFRAEWQSANTGKNRHKTAIIPFGMSIKELGVNPQDSQLVESRKLSRIDICSVFGVPPHLIGETEKTATYASVEQFNIMFAVQCLLPRIVMWEQAIQRDLVLNPKYYVKFSMAALLRGDTVSRYQSYAVGIANGWLNQDEVRDLEDLNPIEDGSGKTYWRPLNWAPLSQIDQPNDAVETPQPAETTDTGADPKNTNDARARLKILAASAAARCVRKENAALAKLTERSANQAEHDKFYTDHALFLAEVLGCSPDAARRYTAETLTLPNRANEQTRIMRLIELAGGEN